MRAVLQRVIEAAVRVEDVSIARIGRGLVAFVGFVATDTEACLTAMAQRIVTLRIFPDDNGKMNRSALEVNAELLVVPEFTLLADCRHGHRPSFHRAAPRDRAAQLFECFITQLQSSPLAMLSGIFEASMLVTLVNDGPVTILLDSPPTDL